MKSAPVTKVVVATKKKLKPVVNARPWLARVTDSDVPWINAMNKQP